MRHFPWIEVLQNADLLDSVVFEDPDGKTDTEAGATSDPHRSGKRRTAWPYSIMGVSATWLERIHQVSVGVPAPDGSPEEPTRQHRELTHRLNRIWEDEAQHALLHPLNAVFGYRPLMIQKDKSGGRRVADRMPGNCLRHLGRLETTAEKALQNQLHSRSAGAFFETIIRGRLLAALMASFGRQ
jgi:hypothetical protein